MTLIIERTMLFADLRGSTGLYESMGNAEATRLVTQSVTLAARVVDLCGGTVVKTLGDGLMAIFETSASAVQAAAEMHDALERIGSAANQSVRLKLQVALARGEVVEMAGDFFGDAVNVAARLLDHAGDNETLATSVVIDELTSENRASFRSLDKMQLRGRIEPVHVYLLDTHRPDSDTTAYADLGAASPDPEGIRLSWFDLNRVYSTSSLPVVLGRSPQATYCIDDARVSRTHARIDWHGGSFQLIDLSFNGTYVRFRNDTEVVSLRRGTCTLHGSGTIGLGASPSDPQAPCVKFEIMRFSDTQPQIPSDLSSTQDDADQR
ncbi:MAG: adenylate/guanylate cyclase domain-containing protein [Pseudomonadota bacterium]